MDPVSSRVHLEMKKDLTFWISSVSSWTAYNVKLSPENLAELLNLAQTLLQKLEEKLKED